MVTLLLKPHLGLLQMKSWYQIKKSLKHLKELRNLKKIRLNKSLLAKIQKNHQTHLKFYLLPKSAFPFQNLVSTLQRKSH